MDEESRLAMYEAQAIAIEQQLEIDILKRERDELIESVRRLGRVDQGNSGQSTSKASDKQEIERLKEKVAEMDELKERLRQLELDKEGKTEQPEAKDQNDVWTVVNGLTGQFANIQDQIQGINSHITRLQNGIEENSRKIWEAINELRQQSTVVKPYTSNKIPKEKNTILIIGNDIKGNPHLVVLSADRTKWIELKLVLPFMAWGSGAVYLNEEIYIFGGQDIYDTVFTASYKALYKLDKNMKWIRLADMNIGRRDITNSCLEWNGYIWICGGVKAANKHLKSVERYDPKKDTWTLMPEMNYARSHGAVNLWNDGIIISGGRTDDGVISYFEYFNLQDNCWSELSATPISITSHSLVIHNQKLIIMGGYDGKRALNCAWEIDSQEINRQPSAKWMPLPPMNYTAHSFAGKILDDEIYAIGGSQGLRQHLNRVEIFDGENWRDGPPLPYPMWNILSVIIPQSLADRLCNYKP